MNLPRPEYPRPQLVRDSWLNLNGEWEYETDRAVSGVARRLFEADSLPERITVPFCRESVLSGIGDTDFCDCVWYMKKLTLPDGFADGRRVLLHIGACDWKTELWVNGTAVGSHRGGYISFSFDITDALKGGTEKIVLRVTDNVRNGLQPCGKQSQKYGSYGCFYTRTTGIWQTVWLESVSSGYIKKLKYYPDLESKSIGIEIFSEALSGKTVSAEAYYEGKSVGAVSATVSGNLTRLKMPLSELHLWEAGAGRLYNLKLTAGGDAVTSYFGMRKITLENGMPLINGKKVFQRLVLDQGFYPDGIYTAPSDAALEKDIRLSLACGFNGARLHQKIFEPRFLYHCDRLGYIVWGEHANWGLDLSRPEAWSAFLPEWLEAVERDFNHPSIVGWCPLNETDKHQDVEFLRFLCDLTRSLDPERPCIDVSGFIHAVPTDVMDSHDYEQNPAKFRENLAKAPDVPFVSEYGGIRWAIDRTGWGYGEAPATEKEFLERFKGLADAMLDNPKICALCYTQLTDVEQEQNGLYAYDRTPKFDTEFFRSVLTRKAAWED